MRSAALLGVLCVAVGCSAKSKPKQAESSVEPIPLASRTAAALHPFVGLRSQHAKLPERADGEIQIGDAVKIVPLGVRSSIARSVAPGAVVYAEAEPFVDRAWLSTGDGVEEWRIVRSKVASPSARYRLSTDLSIAIDHGILTFTDAEGRVRVRSTEPVAIDADGHRVKPTVTLEGAILTVSLDTEGLRLPVAIDPGFVVGPSMTNNRTQHQAVVLDDARVFFMGGDDGTGSYNRWRNADVYNPTTNAFTLTSDTPNGAGGIDFALVKLGSGKILVAGGRGISLPSVRAAAFNPTTSTWTALADLPNSRGNSAVVALSGTKVLLAGGNTVGIGSESCVVYDATANTWTNVASMPAGRSDAQGILLPSGNALVVGGISSPTIFATSYVYNVAANTWAAGPSMSVGRTRFTTTKLPSGKTLVLGGGTAVAELYDPATNKFTTVASMPAARTGQTATLLPTGKVLVTGGGPLAALLYDPATNTWINAGTMNVARSDHAAGLLPDGRVIVTGGSGATASSEIWGGLLGTACTASAQCVSESCVDGVCCSSASCAAGAKCNLPGKAGTCAKPVATPCAAGSECASGTCADGVCCSTTCSGQCSSCNLTGKVGTCSPVLGDPVGGRAACPTTGAGTVCASRCDGIDGSTCTYPGASIACGADACAAGTETRAGTCDGAGACSSITKTCGAYTCGASACRTTCTTSSDCVSGFYCKGSACVPAEGLGTPCKVTADCAVGSCTDGVCCEKDSCGEGSSCVLPGHAGTCKKKLGSVCAGDAECGNDHCVDGVCCDDACNGQCEACDVEGRVGVCSPVVGSPHGARPACDAGKDACSALACLGTADRTTCAGHANAAGSRCAEPRCEGSKLLAASTCDATGTCVAPKESSCVPYVCEGDACRKTCDSDAQCADGYTCKGSRCEPRGATCSADAKTAIAGDGTETDCAPYLCEGGKCSSTCASSNDCSSGFVCDVGSTTCVAATDTSSSGGCSVQHGDSGRSGLAWLAVIGIVIGLRRRAAVAALTLAGCSPSQKTAAPKRDLLAALDSFPAYAARAKRAMPDKTALSVELPSHAAMPLHIARGDDAEAFVDVAMLSTSHAKAERTASGVAIADVAPSTDAYVLVDESGVEDVHVLRDDRAVPRLSLRVTPGPHIASVRVREGRIEALDAQGVVKLSTAPINAVDARGQSRELSVTMDGDRIDAVLDTSGLVHPIAIDPAWSPVASLAVARLAHATVALADGRGLVVGGNDATSGNQPEIYDPVTNTWKKGVKTAFSYGSFVFPAGAAALSSGKVLAVYDHAEIFDPASETWTNANKTSTTAFTAVTVLGDGRALAACAGNGGSTASTELFTAPSTWATAPNMATSRNSGCRLVTLSSGRAFVVGGAATLNAELFDPATNKWTTTSAMKVARQYGPFAVVLGTGKVLVGGGDSTTATELYDPATNVWSTGPAMAHARQNGAAAAIGGGKVLVVGGIRAADAFNNDAEIYDPVTNTFTAAGTMSELRAHLSIARLAGGRVLVPGGGYKFSASPYPTATVDLYGDVLGASCTTNAACATGSCVDGVCCASSACAAPARCDLAPAKGTCTRPLGTVCSKAADCATGSCVDGYCCESACGGQCEACDVPGKLGLCSSVVGAPRGKRPSCTGPGAGTPCGVRCDGLDRTKCSVPGPSASCGVDSCDMGIESKSGTCDASGKCTATTKSCDAYACGATICKSSCTGDVDCAPGFYCKSSACVPIEGLGTPCTSASTCTSGFCTDGVCCGTALCPAFGSCANPESPGVCKIKRGNACTNDVECASAHCVDGVCCDSACDGQCEACDVSGKFGTCTPVDGAPHGTRAGCESGGGACGAKTCAGAIDAKSCAGFLAVDGECAPPSCTGSTYVGASGCTAGSCVAPAAIACAPYACDEAGCRSACSKNEDCAEGNVCSENQCIPARMTCTSDKTQAVAKDGTTTSCLPYLCISTGECGTRCASSRDCAPGAVCDVSSGQCAVPTTDESSGGCSTSRGDKDATPAALLLLVCALALSRARRP